MRWLETYKTLKTAILKQEYAPGTRLVERQIGQELGVSRSGIRTALHQLAAEGLVELRPGNGARVAKVSPEDAFLILDVREALEGMAARLAAVNADSSNIAVMEQILESMGEALGRSDYLRYLELARNFHSAMIDSARNRYLANAIEAAQVRMLQYSTNLLISGRVNELYEGHVAILEPIKERNAEKAEQAARAHIALIKELIEDIPSISF